MIKSKEAKSVPFGVPSGTAAPPPGYTYLPPIDIENELLRRRGLLQSHGWQPGAGAAGKAEQLEQPRSAGRGRGAGGGQGGEGRAGPHPARGDRGIHCSVPSWPLIFLYFSLLRWSLSVPELSHTSHFLKDTGVPAEQNGNINTVHCYQVLIIKPTTVVFNWDKIQQCSDHMTNGIFGYICIHKIISSKVQVS